MSNHKNFQFLLGQTETGAFIAVSRVEPYFCIERDTAEAAEEAALSALRFFGKSPDKPKVKKKSEFKSKEHFFRPQHVVYAEAC